MKIASIADSNPMTVNIRNKERIFQRIPRLLTTDLTLRRMDLRDVPDLIHLYQDLHSMGFTQAPVRLSARDVASMLMQWHSQFQLENGLRWGIEDPSNQTLVGQIILRKSSDKVFMMNYGVLKAYSDPTFLDHVLKPVLKYAFQYCDINEIRVWVHPDSDHLAWLQNHYGFSLGKGSKVNQMKALRLEKEQWLTCA